jgi:hypothetical protein
MSLLPSPLGVKALGKIKIALGLPVIFALAVDVILVKL